MIFAKLRDALQRRRNSYRATFTGPAAEYVLEDLKKFCRATTTPAVVSPVSGQIDPVATGIAIGRLEVWHRIAQHIHISDQDLYKIVNNQGDQDE
jgi:hypothetical protein